MAKYKVIQQINFGSGFVHDRTGKAVPMQNFAPKIGDVIELGELKERTLWSSAPMKGYDFWIKQVGVTPDSLVWIPADAVEKVSDSATVTNTTNKSSDTKNLFTPKKIIIGVVAILSIFGILKVTKVI